MITIDFLKNHPSTIPQLARIWHEGLGKIYLPDIPMERVRQRFHEHLNEETLPLTFVAFIDGEPVGICSLRQNDGIRPDLAPWLGSLLVGPQQQKKGIGRLLINKTKDKIKERDDEKLYLFAFDPTVPNYYARLGWNVMGMDTFKGHPVTVMEIVL